MMTYEITAEEFWRRNKSLIMDPPLVHSEFSQGLHGQKYDMDKIEDGSQAFCEWIDLSKQFIRSNYDPLPDAIAGVANGTNRLAEPVAEDLRCLFLETEKDEDGRPVLTAESRLYVEVFRPVFALILEDVGTRGTNSLSVAQSLWSVKVPKVEVLNTIQRSETLELLDKAGVVYKSKIKRVLPSYTAKECRNRPDGYCARRWELNERSSK